MQLSVLTKHCCLHQHHIISCYQKVFCGSVATVVQALWTCRLSCRHEFNMLMFRDDCQSDVTNEQVEDVLLPLAKYVTLQQPASVLWKTEKYEWLLESQEITRRVAQRFFKQLRQGARARCTQSHCFVMSFVSTATMQGYFGILALIELITQLYLNLLERHSFLS